MPKLLDRLNIYTQDEDDTWGVYVPYNPPFAQHISCTPHCQASGHSTTESPGSTPRSAPVQMRG